MSEQETMKGKIKEIFCGDEEDMEIFAKELCKKNRYDYTEFCGSYLECLIDEGYKDYIITNNKIYEILETKDFEYNDIFEAEGNSDGTISFIVSYYNGGCSFNEAIEEALDNMESK
jgi:hypothetical protein